MFSVIYVYQNNYLEETFSLLCPEKSASFAMVHFQDIHKKYMNGDIKFKNSFPISVVYRIHTVCTV
jgi:hypothetical protein